MSAKIPSGQRRHRLIPLEVYIFVLHRPPQPLDEDVVEHRPSMLTQIRAASCLSMMAWAETTGR